MREQTVRKNKVIVIAGPTASGKTDLAIRLAQEFKGELINADSRQIYSGLDIGTNKGVLTPAAKYLELSGQKLQAYELERSGVYGWLFNFLTPDKPFSVSQFRDYAEQLITGIAAQGKLPVIVGGTGLYIDALLKNYVMPEVKPDAKLRAGLEKLSVLELFSELKSLDKARADSLNESDRQNPRRLIRAIEIARAGVRDGAAMKADPLNEYLLLYPEYDRKELFTKIDRRVEAMMAEGLVPETKNAVAAGYADTEIMHGIGYAQVQQLLKEELSMEEAVQEIQKSHRNYAKRQITWFEGEGRHYDLQRFNFKTDSAEINQKIKAFLL